MDICKDFIQHNEESKAVWDSYHTGNPIRVPVTLWADARYYLFDPQFNPDQKITFMDFIQDPQVMVDVQLKAADWRKKTVSWFCDDMVGPPEKYFITVDMLRFFDAGFFGCDLNFIEAQMPDTTPILAGDRKNFLFHKGLPDPLLGGVFTWAHTMYTKIQTRLQTEGTFQGKPVEFVPFGLETDGPLTVATSLRGSELYLDMYTDPDYVHNLLALITEGTIARIKAHRQFFGLPLLSKSWGYADDAVQMISTDMVKEFVLPYHKELKGNLTTADQISLHLCGDATRHFRLFRDEMNVNSFDTGFPIDFTSIRSQLGEGVEIQGGVRSPQLAQDTPQNIFAETKRILKSGIMRGGRFILKEANDLVPYTPMENLDAMYQAAKLYGVYQ